MAAVPSPRPSGAREPTHGPQLRVVDEPRHTTRYVALLALVAVLGVTGIVSLNALAAEASFEAIEVEKDVAELSHRYDELTAEVAELESPERVRRVATTELGMVTADPVYLTPDGEGAAARPADVELRDEVRGDGPDDADDTEGEAGGEARDDAADTEGEAGGEARDDAADAGRGAGGDGTAPGEPQPAP